jgi:hypothetical protein
MVAPGVWPALRRMMSSTFVDCCSARLAPITSPTPKARHPGKCCFNLIIIACARIRSPGPLALPAATAERRRPARQSDRAAAAGLEPALARSQNGPCVTVQRRPFDKFRSVEVLCAPWPLR